MAADARQSGWTIVELMVSLTMASVLVMLAVKVQRAQQHSIISLRTRAYAVAELRLATEWLRHDLAAGDTVTWNDPWLEIEREKEVSSQHGAWTGNADLGVSYRLDARNLLRVDGESAEEHAVATGIDLFAVDVQAPTVSITLGVDHDDDTSGRTVTLVWEN